jgi:hypothetical protein
MARETVLSRMGAKVKLSQLPIISVRDLVRPSSVRSSTTAAASLTFLEAKASCACCWAGEIAEGAIVVGVRCYLRELGFCHCRGRRDKKHDPFAGIIQIKLLPYNLSRSGVVETSVS